MKHLLMAIALFGLLSSAVQAADETANTNTSPSEPRIFIGAAWMDRLEELRDKNKWAETAPHVGCILHPHNINLKSEQIAIMKEIAPHYRQVVEDSIRFANSKGAYSIYLLSAHGKASENMAMAKDVVRDLEKRNALPYAWAIEDYTKNSDIHMTPERNADGTPGDTVTGLALWIREFYAGKVR
jgi:hypothetical protein